MNTMSFPSVCAGDLTLILGLGETGLAAARWCLEHGARLRVLDTRVEPAGVAVLEAEAGQSDVEFRLGPDVIVAEALADVRRIVVRPRWEERGAGKEGGRTCRSRWWQYLEKKKTKV